MYESDIKALIFSNMLVIAQLTSLGMVTCVVMTGPPMSLYEPLPPGGRENREGVSDITPI